MKLCIFASLVISTSGCDTLPPPVELAASGVEPKVGYCDLAAVLREVVGEGGTYCPDALAEHADRLDAQLKLLAVTGPTATAKLLPADADVLAYWYNARAAWALKLALAAGKTEGSPYEKPAELQRQFPLDGRMMSLADIDAVLAAADDWRIVVVAPGVCLDRAHLPETPFSADDVHTRIAKRLNEFIDDEKRFVVDFDRKEILVPPVLWQFRDLLVRRHNEVYKTAGATLATALLDHVSGSAHRRLQDNVGYRCVTAGPRRKLAVGAKD